MAWPNITLPGGFSPWQATQQLVDDINFLDGGSRDRDIFSQKGNQIMGRDQNAPISGFSSGPTHPDYYKQPANDATSLVPGGTGGSGGGASPAINKAGLNTAVAGLESQLNTLNPQENVAKANILNQFQTSKNRLDTGYNVGLGNLSTSEKQVNAAKERSLKNLRDSILMQSQGYANQLGAFGAGDSSAAGMINYALGQQGARERGNVLEESGAQLTGIQRQREDLERNYQNQATDLENWKNTTLSDIVTKFQAMRNEISNKIVDARARSFAEQNLVNQAVQELQNLENNYRSQAEQMNQLYSNALAPQNIQIDPSLQQYQVQSLSPTSLEALRMPQAVNPESELTALLRRRDEEQNPILGY